MTSEVGRYRLGTSDRLVFDGTTYRCVRSDKDGHVLERVDLPGVAVPISHEVMATLRLKPDFRYDKDYFSPGRAMAVLESGVDELSELPREEQSRILVRFEYAKRFVAGCREGRFNRGKNGWKDALEVLKPEVQAWEVKRSPKRRGLPGDAPPTGTIPPSPRTLRRDVERLEKHDWTKTILRRNTRRSGNRLPRLQPLVVGFLGRGIDGYLSERRRSMTRCHGIVAYLIRRHNRQVDEHNLRIDEHNRRIAESMSGEPLRTDRKEQLAIPDESTLTRRIAKIDQVRIQASREPVQEAANGFAPLSTGLHYLLRPGQRTVSDHWSMPLMAILEDIGVDRVLTKDEKRALTKVTIWVCVVFDSATKCVLGISFTTQPTAESSLCALEMAVSPKQRYAEAVGSLSGWPMECSPDCVVTDAGPEFTAIDYRNKVLDMMAALHTAPAGKPSVRGDEERLFKTFDENFVSEFRGRTFQNPTHRKGYDSKERTSVTVDDVIRALLRYILDVYHNTPHGGLGNKTPLAEWRRLTTKYHLGLPPGRDQRRSIFGIQIAPVVGKHGVTFLGLQYTCRRLQGYFRARSNQTVQVRVDPLDLGAVSVLLPGAEKEDWYTAACRTGGFDGVSVPEWEEIAQRLRREHARDAVLTQDIVDAAITDIRKVSERRVWALGLGFDRPTPERLRALEHSLDIGFRMPDRPDAGAAAQDLLGGGISVRRPPASAGGASGQERRPVASSTDAGNLDAVSGRGPATTSLPASPEVSEPGGGTGGSEEGGGPGTVTPEVPAVEPPPQRQPAGESGTHATNAADRLVETVTIKPRYFAVEDDDEPETGDI